jgi:hypothetical protein
MNKNTFNVKFFLIIMCTLGWEENKIVTRERKDVTDPINLKLKTIEIVVSNDIIT